MTKKLLLIIFLLSEFAILIFASGSTYNMSDEMYFQDSTRTSDSILAVGKTLYKKNCGKCHTLYKPQEFTMKQWKKNLAEMREKSAITEEEYVLITGYLSKNCKPDN